MENASYSNHVSCFSCIYLPLLHVLSCAICASTQVDKAGFEQCLEEEKAKNSVGGGDGGKDMVLMAKETAHLATEQVQPTEQSAKYESGGGGNASLALPAKVMAIFTGRGDSPGEQVFI